MNGNGSGDGTGTAGGAPEGAVLWAARTASPWMYALAAITAAVALVAVALAATGTEGPVWGLAIPFALAAVVTLGCARVEVLVTGVGVKVAFGPLGRPARRFRAADIESAHVEHRRPAQVGGWGYRLSGRGTTVMLRAGECLVIRAKGRNFAVSVDGAERGAAVVNGLLKRE
ncbi:hypothetical protein [Streptomyces flavofungini]|uniref:hypothetical protein n=1 Tax=Streptomyces flavofungini TaxID=68200 RepID=UPI0025B01F9E|nr:hypothetical protein [Streptomyces flavofungini]WJV48105.1 hypothetical protein QUY26_22850 [Streptomyces flavofungini]